LGSNAMYTLQFQRIRVRTLAEREKFAEAEALAVTTLAARRSQMSDLRGNAYTLFYLGRVLVQEGTEDKLVEAEPHLREALRIFREHLPMRVDLAAQAANWLGAIRVAGKAYREAETLLLSGSDELFASAAEMSPTERRLAVSHLVSLYKAWGNPQETALWQTKLDALASKSAQKQGRNIPNGRNTQSPNEPKSR